MSSYPATPQRGRARSRLTPMPKTGTATTPPKVRWQRGEVLGQGAYGTVYLGLNLDTGELMAVKQLDTSEVSEREVMQLENEIELMRGLSHPNIVSYIGTEKTSSELSIFLEFVPGGSIGKIIGRFGALDEAVVRVSVALASSPTSSCFPRADGPPPP